MTLLINAITVGAIVCSLLVITSKNPVISVLFLIAVFVNIAGYLIGIGLGFIGLSYIVVYVGAVAVLFLFVVMMLSLQTDEINASGVVYTQNAPLATIIGVFFLFLQFFVANFHAMQNSIFIQNSTVLNGTFSFFSQNFFVENSDQFFQGDINVNEIFFQNFPDQIFSPVNTLQINSLANILYTNGGLWLMMLAFTLLLAIISPIILTLPKTAFNDLSV